jgi:hypothetical protein
MGPPRAKQSNQPTCGKISFIFIAIGMLPAIFILPLM